MRISVIERGQGWHSVGQIPIPGSVRPDIIGFSVGSIRRLSIPDRDNISIESGSILLKTLLECWIGFREFESGSVKTFPGISVRNRESVKM